MKRLCYLGVPKERFSAYLSPVMSTDRKVTKDKNAVTKFRHLNVTIAKKKQKQKNISFPLLKDTFSLFGSSRCEVLSVLYLKDVFHSVRLSEN